MLLCAIAALAIVTSPVQARRHAPPTPSPTPVPPANPVVTQMARRQFVLWQAGRIDRTEYTASLSAQIDDAKVQQTSTDLGALGALLGLQYLGPVPIPGIPPGAGVYLYKMNCSNGSIYEQLALDASGKVAGIVFRDTLATPTPAP
ncbi:MAG TPA: hypothetical protein VMV82_04470 [Candidatus Dormibacteraeota bacterium]|nr:hypothetical protein [Candidatus Dormibacteraeota bacterium]